MKNIILACVICLLSLAGFGQATLPNSSDVLNKAFAQAKAENKKVLLLFHASWCGWCKKMDASLNDPSCKKMFDDNYVITWLDVMERPEKVNLENPGAMDVMKRYNGEESGLPFWLVLDSNGKELANSEMPAPGAATATAKDNVGCPSEEKEVAYFGKVLKATSPLTNNDIAVIEKRFAQNKAAAH